MISCSFNGVSGIVVVFSHYCGWWIAGPVTPNSLKLVVPAFLLRLGDKVKTG